MIRPAVRRSSPMMESLEGRQLLAATLSVGPITDISKQVGNEVEGQIAVNPANPRNIVAVSGADLNNGNQIVVSRSMDAGATWTRSSLGATQDKLIANTPRVDARVTFDGFGNLYVAYMVAASSSEVRIVVARSADGGVSFPSVTAAVSGTSYDPDCPAIATGPATDAAGQQAVWLSFTDYKSGRVKIVHANASGRGAWGNFTGMTNVSDRFGTYSSVAVGPAGEVAVAYQDNDSSQGPSNIYVDIDVDGAKKKGKFGTDRLATSTNVGGWDFIPAQPNRSIDAEPKIAFDKSNSSTRGRLYLIYTDENINESNDTDIYLRYSTNKGSTWSARTRVNNDTTKMSQFLPALAVDPVTGNVGVSWYDARNSTDNKSVQLFATVSTDHGLTFSANTAISGMINQAYATPGSTLLGDLDLGDQTGLAFYNGKLIPVWADNSIVTVGNPNGVNNKLDLAIAVISVL